MRHVLSFDVEEYFQVESLRGTIGRDDWERWPSRVEPVTAALLDLLDEAGVRATFFVLGWVARRHPRLVRAIADRGHEVASHGYGHRMATDMGRREFAEDVRRARLLLSDLAGQDVLGYRAPTFSVTPANPWAFDVLREQGHGYDSSVFPIRHDRYGWPDFPPRPVRIVWPDGGVLDEYPLATLDTPFGRVPVAGGGYLRALPEPVFRWAWRRLTRAGRPSVFYLHPWELDADQPRVPVGWVNRWRHYVGLSGTAGRLRRLLREFRWTSFRELRAAARPLTRLARESWGEPQRESETVGTSRRPRITKSRVPAR
ncbi:MAG TPA: XrtA system polysaccharide deacetylase [Gemmatimonadales bacterium]|nr:XrtA system polysaccharide deacetylase [Gemmatimonadales bacterium]